MPTYNEKERKEIDTPRREERKKNKLTYSEVRKIAVVVSPHDVRRESCHVWGEVHLSGSLEDGRVNVACPTRNLKISLFLSTDENSTFLPFLHDHLDNGVRGELGVTSDQFGDHLLNGVLSGDAVVFPRHVEGSHESSMGRR